MFPCSAEHRAEKRKIISSHLVKHTESLSKLSETRKRREQVRKAGVKDYKQRWGGRPADLSGIGFLPSALPWAWPTPNWEVDGPIKQLACEPAEGRKGCELESWKSTCHSAWLHECQSPDLHKVRRRIQLSHAVSVPPHTYRGTSAPTPSHTHNTLINVMKCNFF